MYYVYLLRSLKNPHQTYIGYTINLLQRLDTHNSGGSVHTKNGRPWKLVMYLAFESEQKALAFEKYIKSLSENSKLFNLSSFSVRPECFSRVQLRKMYRRIIIN